MKIEYRVGNMFDAPGRFLVHGCNAQGVMGSGVAKSIRALYPLAYERYVERHAQTSLQVGEVITVDCGRYVIFNAITQEFYGREADKGVVYVSYDGVSSAFYKIDQMINEDLERETALLPRELRDEMFEPEVAMPLIGAVLAGGDWRIISERIEKAAKHFKPVVYVQTQDQLNNIIKLLGE